MHWIEGGWGAVASRIGRAVPGYPLMIILSCLIGVTAGFGAVIFTWMIEAVSAATVEPIIALPTIRGRMLICLVPAAGLLTVSWLTRRFAPEAEGHGIPEVILAVARRDGVIRPRVSVVKILASALCIGTGGSVGREGPIVQIGSALGSTAGQFFRLSAPNVKVLVACGAAAGISATFNAPLAGVIFASEIILGSFAVQSLTPIVIASVLANVVQERIGEHGLNPVFEELNYEYLGAVNQLPPYFVLGLLCGLSAVAFTKSLYWVEDASRRVLPQWWLRAVAAGCLIGVVGFVYPVNPLTSTAPVDAPREPVLPPVFGVGYDVVDQTLRLENVDKPSSTQAGLVDPSVSKVMRLDTQSMLAVLWWLLPLVVLKPLLTSVTLAGGGSGGIFAPSLFLGATLGACFGLVANLVLPSASMHPGVYAVVGMGAVVAGTTHGLVSAMLIVYEMTNDYQIILPIMITAGISSAVAILVDRESIYHKKLSRRGVPLSRGHDLAALEHVMVRDLMVRQFPTIRATDTMPQIVQAAKDNPKFESLPVVDHQGELLGIVRPEDLRRLLDSDIVPQLLRASDIVMDFPMALSPDENLLEALRDFGTRDVESLPVKDGQGSSRKLVGLLFRSDVMRRYRAELLRTGAD